MYGTTNRWLYWSDRIDMMNFDYLYKNDLMKRYIGKDLRLNKKLGCEILRNAIVLPNDMSIITGLGWGGGGGVVDSEGKFIHNSFMHPIEQDASYKPKSIKYSDETAIYLGMFRHVWGHVLTDNIKRLWFLKSDLYKQYFKGAKLIYIPMWDFNMEKQDRDCKRLLEIFGLDVSNLQPITEATQYKNLIMPEMSFLFYQYWTEEYKETITCIRDFAIKNYKPLPFKKVYFWHGGHFGGAGQIGEERIAQYFQSKGYAIIKGHEISSFDEELNVLINCESFASTTGSCAQNMIFLRDGTEVIFIPRAVFEGGYLETQACARDDLRITYIDSSLSVCAHNDFPWGGPFFYFLSKNLLKYFGDTDGKDFKYSYDDFKTFLIYLKASLRAGLKVAPKFMDYYGEVYKDFVEQLKQQKQLLQEEGVTIN